MSNISNQQQTSSRTFVIGFDFFGAQRCSLAISCDHAGILFVCGGGQVVGKYGDSTKLAFKKVSPLFPNFTV